MASAIGLSDAIVPTDEVFWGVRRLLETIARRQPLVVVIDDLQWAEPTLLELVEHVADLSRDAPILLLAIARPELLDLARTGAAASSTPPRSCWSRCPADVASSS